jgi:O-antigen/teichoic acid export membrane protein
MHIELNDIGKASARGSFFLFLGKTSSTIIMAIASILVARLLGPENYGLYVVAMIIPSILVTLSDFGISSSLIKFCAQFSAERKDKKVVSLIKTGILFNLILALLISLVLLLFSESIATWVLRRPSLDLIIRFTTVYVVGQMFLNIVVSVFIGLDKTEKSGLIMNVQAIIKAVASPLLVLGMGVLGAVLGAGVGVLLAAVTGITMLVFHLYAVDKKSGEGNVNFTQGLRIMITYGMPLYLSILILGLLTQYKSFLLALFVSDAEIGNYTIAINFSVLITLISYPIATSLFPAFSKLSIKKEQDAVERMFKFSVKYVSLLLIPASIALAVLSKEAVYTLYGSQYQLAPSYLSIYVLSFLCAGFGMYVVSSFFNGQGDTMATLRINIINICLAAPLAFIATFLYGVLGLVISLVATDFLSNAYALYLARKKYKVTVDWASFLRIAIASLSSALLVYLFITFTPIHDSLFKLAVGGLIYVTSFLAFAPLLKAISKEDIRNLNELTKELTLIYPITKRILSLEEKILALNVTL